MNGRLFLLLAAAVVQPAFAQRRLQKTYSDRTFGVAFRYPASLRPQPLGLLANPTRSSGDKLLVMLGLPGSTQAPDSGEKLHLYVSFRNRPMTNRLLELEYAPTGYQDLPPERRTYGRHQVVFYGPGGGGVFYPDKFFVLCRGGFLRFAFYGPPDADPAGNLKSPGAATRTVEAQLLSSLRLSR